jgi:hypothetical protein
VAVALDETVADDDDVTLLVVVIEPVALPVGVIEAVALVVGVMLAVSEDDALPVGVAVVLRLAVEEAEVDAVCDAVALDDAVTDDEAVPVTEGDPVASDISQQTPARVGQQGTSSSSPAWVMRTHALSSSLPGRASLASGSFSAHIAVPSAESRYVAGASDAE